MSLALEDRAPSLRLWAGEALEIPKLLLSPFQRAVPIVPGQGQPVLVLPGYLTSDISSIRLRRSLNAAGYRAFGWGMGQNRGLRPGLIENLGNRIDALAGQHGQAVSLIGWSLGGLFAREVAKIRPDAVRLILTLGSPFSGNPRANNAWRLYEWLNGHPVDDPPIELDLRKKPPQQTVAVFSPIDGIVSPASACGQPEESDRQIVLEERHLSLARAPQGIRMIGQVLAEELPARS